MVTEKRKKQQVHMQLEFAETQKGIREKYVGK